MPLLARALERLTRRLLRLADAGANRLYGWRGNPLYQSGTIVVLLFLILLATGLWLLLFYRIGAPWQSVASLTARPWVGNWVRGLHRYASDAAVVATVVHALRMVAQGRSWGPRVLAWVSGVLLLGLLYLCGVTGFVMVWDGFGQALAVESARVVDALPILSEPVSRAFTGERPVQGVFFFLTLFLHVAWPLALALGLWLHVSRVARPTLLPPRQLSRVLTGALLAVAVCWPLTMAPEASAFVQPASVPFDWFFGFWLPITRPLPASLVWLAGAVATTVLIGFPRWSRRRGPELAAPSAVDAALCTGCRQCGLDCPYEAITMLPRTDGRADVVAAVDPDRCVSCGICAGSCAPMGVGPPGRTGRDQLEAIHAFMADPARRPGEVVAIACGHGPAALSPAFGACGAAVHQVDCAGNLHTSVIEYLVRAGAGGVLVFACPPRDCRNREGPVWLRERIYHDREAELKARVDRRRVAIAYASAGDRQAALLALRDFQQAIAALQPVEAETGVRLEAVCEPAAEEEMAG
jgi:coenzyme F420-reducing hydrogenase delta subunit/Pyruvate/2-oxoacid:ferredoxin oxidoreductase delta subunit